MGISFGYTRLPTSSHPFHLLYFGTSWEGAVLSVVQWVHGMIGFLGGWGGLDLVTLRQLWADDLFGTSTDPCSFCPVILYWQC
ncbi:hypothetical protein GDO81_021388 [Engystomops pustulosus]|uniref:Uncharacterized protein n=1 Tax=Engystomops pustulosus TaxID=76066 RepID=A0AAV6ZCU4_ENGPU|nr:hypothetical protein GDO81_021388 [Engystomops pustulosus]